MMKNARMNDKKGMFLAIAAVLAMIFAGAAVVMASGEDVDATDATQLDLKTDGTAATVNELDTTGSSIAYYSQNATIDAFAGAHTVYIQNGVTLTLNATADWGAALTFFAGKEINDHTYKYLKGTAAGEPADSKQNDTNVVIQLKAGDSITITAEFGKAKGETGAGTDGTSSSFTISGHRASTGTLTISLNAIETIDVGTVEVAASGSLVSNGATVANIGFNYGVYSKVGTVYTWYGTSYSSAITATLTATTDTVHAVKVSDLTVNTTTTEGSQSFIFTGFVGTNVSDGYTSADSMTVVGGAGANAPVLKGVKTLAGTTGAGTLKISGTGKVDMGAATNYIIFAPTKTIEVGEGINLAPAVDVTFKGTLVLKGILTTNSESKNLNTGDTTGDLQVRYDAAATYAQTGTDDGVFTWMPIDTEAVSKISGAVSGQIYGKTLGGAAYVPEDEVLTVTGDLLLNGQVLTVNGTLEISASGHIYDYLTTGAIKLAKDAVLIDNGNIGGTNAVTISTTAAGATLTAKYVKGLEFDVTSTTVMELNGNIQSTGTGSAVVFGNDTGLTIGDLTVGTSVTLTLSTTVTYTLAEASELIVAGTITSSDTTNWASAALIDMKKNSDVAITGSSVDIKYTASTGKITPGSPETFAGTSQVAPATVKGFGIGITRASDGTNAYQRMVISGDVVLVTGAEGTLNIDGEVFIAADDEVTVATGITLDKVTSQGYINALGDLTLVGTAAIDGTDVKVNAAKYAITVTGVTTKYYTSVADAIEMISLADSKSVDIMSDKVAASFTIGSGETVTMAPYQGADVEVAGAVSVAASGALTCTVMKITGSLTVAPGASCSNPATYDVKSTSTDGTIVYAGLAVALENAHSGDVIDANAVTVSKDLTIPAGVTLNVKTSLGTTKNVTIEEGASLVLKSSAAMTTGTADYSINVNGTLDCSKGTYTGNAVVKASGIAVFAAGTTVSHIGASFTTTDYCITSLENASLLVSEGTTVYVTGIYAEAGEFEFEGVNVVIAANSIVSVGSLRFVGAGISLAAGTSELNGTIALANGSGDASAVVKVSKYKAEGAALVSTSSTDPMGVTTYAATINAVNGTVSIMSGDIKMADSFAVAANSALTVDANAKFVVPSGKTLTCSEATATVTVDGTIEVLGTLTVTDSKVAVNGDAVVKKTTTATGTANISKLNVLGTVTVDEGATFNLKGGMFVGTAPGSTGAGASFIGKLVTTTAVAPTYIVVYPGSDISLLVVDADVQGASQGAESVFEINDSVYMTVIVGTNQAANVNNVVGTMTFKVPGLDQRQLNALTTFEGWGLTANETIGTTEVIDKTIASAEVPVKFSWDTGMSLYVDNIRITGDKNLSVGVHTAMVKVNPGYKFADGTTPTISFNGKVLSGLLTFEVTSDMVNPVLSAVGDVVVDEQPIPEQKEKDDTMMIILLAILVIMIAILVVVVILRMMRS